MEIKQRQDRARKLMENNNFGALVVASPENIQYLTGVIEPSIHTCGIAVIPQQDQATLAVMWLDKAAAELQSNDFSVQAYTADTRAVTVINILERLGIRKGKIGMDGHALGGLGNALTTKLPNVEFVNASNRVEELRWIKSAEEINQIQKACQIADQGMQTALESIKPGMTEIQIASIAEQQMVQLGAENKMKHATFVASGLRAGFVHPIASEKKVAQGDLVAIDLGAVFQGYCSDLARTYVVGKPQGGFEEDFNTLYDAQQAVLRLLRPGISMQKIETTAHEVTKATGCQLIGHIGHSIGLKVEEHPRLRTIRTPYPNVKLQKNMVIAFFQSMIQSKRSLGIRLEDTIVITDSGAKFLTVHPRELFSQ
ncbi:MAG: aminopeptidase P family protein [Candidatus Bathyarchaeota archaeon]|nr:MAG: aminopeptidase P family protein [Candidatus Bathyarchaeota archaeon]